VEKAVNSGAFIAAGEKPTSPFQSRSSGHDPGASSGSAWPPVAQRPGSERKVQCKGQDRHELATAWRKSLSEPHFSPVPDGFLHLNLLVRAAGVCAGIPILEVVEWKRVMSDRS